VGAVFYRDLVRNYGGATSRLQIAPTGMTRNFKLWERFSTAILSATYDYDNDNANDNDEDNDINQKEPDKPDQAII
jgi:hypothetical protein